ncbi:MAG TPA: hypothetical protein VGH04_01480, partial [Gemmatimonadaceae bacterium]
MGITAVHLPSAFDRAVTATLKPPPAGVTVIDAFGIAAPLSLFTLPVSVSLCGPCAESGRMGASVNNATAR